MKKPFRIAISTLKSGPENELKSKFKRIERLEFLLKNLELNAEESPEINFIPRFRYLKQGNISYSRKKILPLIIESASK